MAKEIDRLSALPDELLVHILGDVYQYDTKEAAKKTATLSKRWRFLWTKLPLHSFTSRDMDETGRSFARVGEALAARKRATLDLEHYCSFSLYLSSYYDEASADDLVALLDVAAESRVSYVDLKLTAVRYSVCTLPQALYSYSSLRKLSFTFLKLVPPATTVEWGLMTEISLLVVHLPQQALDQIVSSCPLLIRLKVHDCWGFNRLDVRGRRFRELDVANGCDVLELLEVSAPYMTSFNVCINPQYTTLRLTDVSSVEQVRILFDYPSDDEKEMEMEMFRNNEQLFQLLQRVPTLVLNFEFIQVLSNMRRDRGQLPKFRVQHLTIRYDIDIDTDNIAGVLAILESSPFLDKLVILDMSEDKHRNMNWDPSVGVDLICDLLHLKTVEIKVYVDPELPHELSFTLAQILLRRAPVLEEMVIRGVSTTKSADYIELAKKYETLLTYPKSSHKAVVQISF